MDILILDSWLREHLETNAKPQEIARSVSLCGPTFDYTQKHGKDWLYKIEVTTNRVDAMSVRGIAREASVILPEFGYKAKLKPLTLGKPTTPSKSLPLSLSTSAKLTNRVMGVILEVENIGKSPAWMQERLAATGIRSINAAVDITNYIMTEVGHPTHVFDYDLVAPTMILRESKKGETIESFDGKKHKLPGGDIVIDNGKDEIIDLPGIIGTKNSVVQNSTKRILFFLESNDPVRIRKTSMTLGIRTVAATLNEKGVDPELAPIALNRGIDLFKKLLKAKVVSKIYDIYSKKEKSKSVSLTHSFVETRLGAKIESSKVVKILTNLGFEMKYNLKTDMYQVLPPSFRAKDVQIPEDVVEEVARIYGYHNLQSTLMTGSIPDPLPNAPFKFEIDIKRLLMALGGNEIYTYSLVSKDMTDRGSLSLRNPLGNDASHLRTSLKQSLIAAADSNKNEKEGFHLFEMAKVYLPKKNALPEERIKLAGVFYLTDYREAKGAIEYLANYVNPKTKLKQVDSNAFLPSHRIEFSISGKTIGEFGVLESGQIYYEFDMELLQSLSNTTKSYSPIPKYPAQIEDVTFALPDKTPVLNVIETIKESSKLISKVELVDTYESSYTFRVWYQDVNKTLTDDEVETIRSKFTANAIKEIGVRVK